MKLQARQMTLNMAGMAAMLTILISRSPWSTLGTQPGKSNVYERFPRKYLDEGSCLRILYLTGPLLVTTFVKLHTQE
jgi:hypothetical protein